jgi:N,N'-diacetyllegionaminate synthase
VKSEVFIKKHALKSIVAKNIIKKGEIFSDDNITTRRAGNGLSATYWDLVIGKSAIRNFNEGENIEL